MTPKPPKTPNELRVERYEQARLKTDVEKYGVAAVVRAEVREDLVALLPALAKVAKLNVAVVHDAVDEAFDEAWTHFQSTDPGPSDDDS